jgi:hypothetical protein
VIEVKTFMSGSSPGASDPLSHAVWPSSWTHTAFPLMITRPPNEATAPAGCVIASRKSASPPATFPTAAISTDVLPLVTMLVRRTL